MFADQEAEYKPHGNDYGNNENNVYTDDKGGVKPFTSILDANFDSRANFIRKVYIILSVQLACTVGICGCIWYGAADGFKNKTPPAWLLPVLGTSAAVLLVLVILSCCMEEVLRKVPWNYIYLTVFTAAVSLIVGTLVLKYSLGDVFASAAITLSVFVCLTLFAVVVKTDFTGCGPYLFAGLFVLICFSFVVGLFPPSGLRTNGALNWLRICINVGTIILFSFYIIYDTQLIVGGKSKEYSSDDYVFAAINLYMDIINMFLAILSLLGNN